jgi:hypothetical protein
MGNKVSFPEEYHERVLAEKYKSIFNAIEQVKDLDQMTISELKEFIEEHDMELIIVLGNNCSGVDILDLNNMSASEWTW